MVFALRPVNDPVESIGSVESVESIESIATPSRASLPELQALVGRAGGRVGGVERMIPVRADLAALLPLGGIRRGTVAEISHCGLLYAALADAMAEGAWAVLVGAPSLGLAAAADHGVPLERLAIVATPPPDQTAVVVAALLDAIDLVVLGPQVAVRPSDARRLSARLRERNGVLFAMGTWPENAELKLAVTATTWGGADHGHGHLRGWSLQVAVRGRGAAAQGRRGTVSLAALPVTPTLAVLPQTFTPTPAPAPNVVEEQFSLERVS